MLGGVLSDGMSELFNLNQFYELLAPLYGPVMRLLPMWQGYTEAVLPHLAGCERVLEIGPGPGTEGER